MAFCKNCGKELMKDEKFCTNCGTSVSTNESNKRKTKYEGEIHKCPNCGESLGSFVIKCPSCGHEIRGSQAVSSVREFALKLERIEAQKMPVFEAKKSVLKKVFGKDFNGEDEVEEAREAFEEEKKQEKANMIINYSVPNTKEDIVEFMLLAASNIDAKFDFDNVVSKAWNTKFEQIYQKAKLSMNSSDFLQIENIYYQKKKQIKDKRIKILKIVASCVVGYFFIMLLLINPFIAFAILAVILLVICRKYFIKR